MLIFMLIIGIHVAQSQNAFNLNTLSTEDGVNGGAVDRSVTQLADGYEVTYRLKNLCNANLRLRNEEQKAVYESLVREDRVWKYKSTGYDYSLNLKFDGTSEINGHEYHNVYVWKDSEEYSETNRVLIGYMRQEGNKVYSYNYPTLVDLENNVEEKYGISLSSYGPTTDYCFQGDVERLIYDFSLVDDERMYISANELLPTAHANWGVLNSPVKPYLTVYNCKNVDYEGKEFGYQEYGGIWNGYDVYAGIGATMGLLPFPGSGISGILNQQPYYLTSVVDLEGNVVFNPSVATAGIENISTVDSPASEVYYFDLNGQRIANPAEGISIKVTVYHDGRRVTEKIIN